MTTSTSYSTVSDRIAAGVMVTASGLIMASSVAIYLLGAEAAGGAMGIVGAALMGAAAPGITRPLQSRMPRAAAVMTTVFAYGFVVGGVAFNLETVMVAEGMLSLESLSIFPVLGMSGVLGPLSLVAIGAAMVRSGVARNAGAALALGGVLFPVSRVGDIAGIALTVDMLLLAGFALLARELVRTPVRSVPVAQPVAA